MYYRLIEKKRNEWFLSGDCPVRELVRYIQERGKMRDTQIEAIKTYLFLLIKCENKPLWKLFSSGFFNTLDLQETELRQHTREYMLAHPNVKQEEVALHSGFSSSSYFSKVFSREEGITPVLWRKAQTASLPYEM